MLQKPCKFTAELVDNKPNYIQSINPTDTFNQGETYQIERAYSPILSKVEKECTKLSYSKAQNQNIDLIDSMILGNTTPRQQYSNQNDEMRSGSRRSDSLNPHIKFCQDYLINNKHNKLIKSDKFYLLCTKYYRNLTNTFAAKNGDLDTDDKNLIVIEFDIKNKDSMQMIEYIFPLATSSPSLESKKCLPHRNTLLFKLCLLKNYKCFKYRDDPVKLKNCRNYFKIDKLPKKNFFA